jgi:tRNA A37 threonylcarbamoyladenosine biosynthesis protein TsaE
MRNWLNIFSKTKKPVSTMTYTELGNELDEFSRFVNVNGDMAFVLSVYCMMRNRKNYVKIDDLLEELEPHVPTEYTIEQVEKLVVAGWFVFGGEGPFSNSYDQIFLTHTAENALKSSNKAALPKKSTKQEDVLILTMYARAISFRNRSITLREWAKFVKEAMNHKKVSFMSYLQSKKLKREHQNIALYVGLICLVDNVYSDLSTILALFSDNPLDYSRKKKQLTQLSHALYENEVLVLSVRDSGTKRLAAHEQWVQRMDGNTVAEPSFTLQNKTLEWVSHKNIVEKNLLYNPEVEDKVSVLKKILEPENLKKFSQQAKKNGENSGIIVLLSGGPGTGKTELAKQLALSTKRDLLAFDVSQQRNMYYGESEKAIKSVFDDYKRLHKHSGNAPILFFNEADSVFGRRQQGNFNTSMTENTIQTILLNELENFNGILICTTNVPEQFDSAFSRRFLIEIAINNPDEAVRAQLILQLFPNFHLDKAEQLAAEYNFTAAELGKFRKNWELRKIAGMNQGTIEENLSLFLADKEDMSRWQQIGFRA